MPLCTEHNITRVKERKKEGEGQERSTHGTRGVKAHAPARGRDTAGQGVGEFGPNSCVLFCNGKRALDGRTTYKQGVDPTPCLDVATKRTRFILTTNRYDPLGLGYSSTHLSSHFCLFSEPLRCFLGLFKESRRRRCRKVAKARWDLGCK